MRYLIKKPQVILSVLCISFIYGCSKFSPPEVNQDPISLIEQISIDSTVNSRKFNYPKPQQINILKGDYLVINDETGDQYGIISKKVLPFKHGTIELKFRLTHNQRNEPGRNKNNLKQLSVENNSAGIAFSTVGEKIYFGAIVDQSGKLTFGKIGDVPLVSKQLDIDKVKVTEITTLKISFMNGNLLIFINNDPIIQLSNIGIYDVETLAFMAKFFPQSDRKIYALYDETGIKYRKLDPLPEINSQNIFRYLEEEDALSKAYYSEKSTAMNLFKIPEDFLQESDVASLMVDRATIESETRTCLLAPAPTNIKFPISIPPKSYMNFAYAIAPPGWEKSDGMTFSIYFITEEGDRKTLFSRFLDTQNIQNRKWFEEKLDLSVLAGLTGELILETIPSDKSQADSNKWDMYFDLGLWGEPVIYHGERNTDEYNVILISLDTLRADHLGSYGYFRNTSPHIDALAKTGLRFENAVTQAPWTLPSHMAMLTSMYPSALGYSLINKINNKVRIPDEATTLAEVLKENGYNSVGFTGGANVSRTFGFDQGFSIYNEKWGRKIEVQYKIIKEWIEENYKSKFFLFFHTYEIHDYPPGEHETFTVGIDRNDKINLQKALYDGKIRFVDNYIGLLVELLKSLNIFDKTLIVITSDHGTAFKEHGLWGHGDQLYDEVLLVPLIFHLNGKIPQNIVLDKQVRTIDIMPTVLDILNIDPQNKLEGVSLVPRFNNGKNENLVAFSEGTKYDSNINIIEPRSIRTPEHKFIYYPKLGEDILAYLKSREEQTGHSVEVYNQGDGELFNLFYDSMELNNIIKLNNALATKFKKDIESIITMNRNKNITKGKAPETVKIDKATLNRLKALGYLQ